MCPSAFCSVLQFLHVNRESSQILYLKSLIFFLLRPVTTCLLFAMLYSVDWKHKRVIK